VEARPPPPRPRQTRSHPARGRARTESRQTTPPRRRPGCSQWDGWWRRCATAGPGARRDARLEPAPRTARKSSKQQGTPPPQTASQVGRDTRKQKAPCPPTHSLHCTTRPRSPCPVEPAVRDHPIDHAARQRAGGRPEPPKRLGPRGNRLPARVGHCGACCGARRRGWARPLCRRRRRRRDVRDGPGVLELGNPARGPPGQPGDHHAHPNPATQRHNILDSDHPLHRSCSSPQPSKISPRGRKQTL